MGWETHSGRQYLYKSYRDQNGHVRRKYLGCGPAAIMEAARCQQRRQQEENTRQAVAHQQAQGMGLQQQIQELDQGLQELLAAELFTAGFHMHAGIWRKRRGRR